MRTAITTAASSEFHGSGLHRLAIDLGICAVTKELPFYPRLHNVDDTAQPFLPPVSSRTFDTVANSFSQATGWTLLQNFTRNSADQPLVEAIRIAPRAELLSETHLTESIERWRAEQLAQAFATLIDRVDDLQRAVLRREAELATGVPVSVGRQDEEHIAARLEVMLRNGAAAVDCQAAGLYLLDDTTTELKLRAAWGLPSDRLLQPARSLAEAYAELEALIGHAVVLEDVKLLPHWKIPEPFPAALCLPVLSSTDALGTIWFYADSVRDFSDQQVHLAEIIAGSIAAELQREMLLNECIASKQADRQVIGAVQWQQDHLPNIEPIVDGWEVAGWVADDDEVSNSFYDWFVPPDGSLAVVVGCSDGSPLETALSTAALQASVRSHAEYTHDARTMVGRANTTVWNASAGGHNSSLFYCKATPESGKIEYASAGNIAAVLVTGDGAELIPTEGFQLGIDPDMTVEQTCVELSDDDFLIIIDTPSIRPSQQLELARQLRQHRGAETNDLLQLVQLADPASKSVLLLRQREGVTN